MFNNVLKIDPALRWGLAALSALYILVSAVGLERYPTVWVDEGWIAEPAATWAAGEPLGSPSHGPLYHYADRLYWMPPLTFIALGGLYAGGGDPLVWGRWGSLLAGLCTLWLLTALAGAVLRGSGGERSQIPPAALWFWTLVPGLLFTLDPMLWKTHRTIRFEPWVVLGLVAAVACAWPRGWRWRGVGVGLASAFALSCHPNGILAAPAAAGVLFLRRRSGREFAGSLALAAVAGLAAMTPTLVYLAGDRAAGWANLLGQNAPHLDGRDGPVWEQWWREPARYAAYFAWPRLGLPALAWAAVFVAGLRWRAPRSLLWVTAVTAAGLACTPNKTELYLTLLAPWIYLLGAWLLARNGRRVAVLVVLLWAGHLAAADAALLWRNRHCDYRAWSGAIDALVPERAAVAGSFLVWFPLRERSFLEIHRRKAGDLYDARPEYVVWGDVHTADPYFERMRRELEPVLARHADVIGGSTDPCYGATLVYRVQWEEVDPALAAGWERYGKESN